MYLETAGSNFYGSCPRAIQHVTRNGKGVKPLIREDGDCLLVTQHKLTRDEVVELIDHLQRWVDEGYL